MMPCAPVRTVMVLLFVFAAGIVCVPAGGQVTKTAAPLERDEEPVLVSGAALAALQGTPVSDLALYRYDAAAAVFVPVPFQIDQRVDHVFNPGTELEFVQNIYDVQHEDDGLLDGDDELVFLFGDAGVLAPPSAAWPDGAGATRYEIATTDTRPGAPVPCRWVYLFEGAALPRAATAYISWNLLPSGTITTPSFALDFADRWLLTGYRVFPPCGSGRDLVDRWKGRANPYADVLEDEERWNSQSSFLGGILGPVRAIRYVRGAASAVNMVHVDLVYRKFWFRELDLRVHTIAAAWFYMDWLPLPSARLFTPLARNGVPVDGQPDPIGTAWTDWTLFASGEGGLVELIDVPASPYYATKEFLYRDQSSYDDTIPTNPGYADDDDAAYGNEGVRLAEISECNLTGILAKTSHFVLCAGSGDATLGDAYEAMRKNPFAVTPAEQWHSLGPVRSLTCRREGQDIVLDWSAVPGADSYHVYEAGEPDLPANSWAQTGETTAPHFVDEDAAVSGQSAYWSIVGVNPNGEGSW